MGEGFLRIPSATSYFPTRRKTWLLSFPDLSGIVGSEEMFAYTNMELLILIRITPSGYVAIMTSLSRRYIYELYFHFVTRDTEVLLWM